MSAKNQIPRFATVEDVIDELKPGYPVYCLRPQELKRQAEYFLDTFPGRVMYAVKCNPHLTVLKALYEAGIRHFDTASLAEIALVAQGHVHDAAAQPLALQREALHQVRSLLGIRQLVAEALARVGVAFEEGLHLDLLHPRVERRDHHVALQAVQDLTRLVGERVDGRLGNPAR